MVVHAKYLYVQPFSLSFPNCYNLTMTYMAISTKELVLSKNKNNWFKTEKWEFVVKPKNYRNRVNYPGQTPSHIQL